MKQMRGGYGHKLGKVKIENDWDTSLNDDLDLRTNNSKHCLHLVVLSVDAKIWRPVAGGGD